MGVFGLHRVCKSVTILGPSDRHPRFVLRRSKNFFLSSHNADNSDEESSGFTRISRPLQCSDGTVKQLADMAGPFNDFRIS